MKMHWVPNNRLPAVCGCMNENAVTFLNPQKVDCKICKAAYEKTLAKTPQDQQKQENNE